MERIKRKPEMLRTEDPTSLRPFSFHATYPSVRGAAARMRATQAGPEFQTHYVEAQLKDQHGVWV
jgi:hypothetical protein